MRRMTTLKKGKMLPHQVTSLFPNVPSVSKKRPSSRKTFLYREMGDKAMVDLATKTVSSGEILLFLAAVGRLELERTRMRREKEENIKKIYSKLL